MLITHRYPVLTPKLATKSDDKANVKGIGSESVTVTSAVLETTEERLHEQFTELAGPEGISNVEVSILTESEVTETLVLVSELQQRTSLLSNKKETQTTFVVIPDVIQVEAEMHVISVVVDNPVRVVASDNSTQPPIAADAVLQEQSVTEQAKFVVPELIAKVVSTSAVSWSAVGLQLAEKTVMLLKNGMAYTNLTTPPRVLELPDSIVSGSTNWTTWRQDESGAIYLATPGGTSESLLSGQEIDLTPLENIDVAGLHTKMTAATYGATMVTTWSDIRFSADGTFEQSSSVLTTTGGAGTLLLDTFTASFHQHTASGTSNIVSGKSELSGDAFALNANDAALHPNKYLYGTFNLLEDGLTVEMHYANGAVRKELLYRNDNYLHFGTSSYRTQPLDGHYLENLRSFAQGMAESKRVIWLSLLADSVAADAKKRGAPIQHQATNGTNTNVSGDS